MPEKPTTAGQYRPEWVDEVRSICLYVATRLGDLRDEVVVVGGLVPTLLISQDPPGAGVARHVGTRDLDLGLSVALLEDARYQTLSARLREAGFVPSVNEAGNQTLQTWMLAAHPAITVDFLIAPAGADARPGRPKHLEPDFAPLNTPALDLAFRDRVPVPLRGVTPRGERVQRDVWCCGPGAFTVLKALACSDRGHEKDAYDLAYVLRYFGRGPDDVARHLRPLLGATEAARAVAVLREDFLHEDGLGPVRAARFMALPDDDAIAAARADVVTVVRRLLMACGV